MYSSWPGSNLWSSSWCRSAWLKVRKALYASVSPLRILKYLIWAYRKREWVSRIPGLFLNNLLMIQDSLCKSIGDYHPTFVQNSVWSLIEFCHPFPNPLECLPTSCCPVGFCCQQHVQVRGWFFCCIGYWQSSYETKHKHYYKINFSSKKRTYAKTGSSIALLSCCFIMCWTQSLKCGVSSVLG